MKANSTMKKMKTMPAMKAMKAMKSMKAMKASNAIEYKADAFSLQFTVFFGQCHECSAGHEATSCHEDKAEPRCHEGHQKPGQHLVLYCSWFMVLICFCLFVVSPE